MNCVVALVCALTAIPASGAPFPERTPEQILRRVDVCHTRMCCLYQATLRRLPEDLPPDSAGLEAIVLKTFLEDRDEIEMSCHK